MRGAIVVQRDQADALELERADSAGELERQLRVADPLAVVGEPRPLIGSGRR
jgi:hypothetical protein